MSELDPRERMMLQARALEALRQRLLEETHLTVEQVAERWGVSRTTVEALPEEILPCEDLSPTAGRRLRRYSPAEVQAAAVRLRRWRRAQQAGRGEAYLRELRAELAEREEEILRAARELAVPRPVEMLVA